MIDIAVSVTCFYWNWLNPYRVIEVCQILMDVIGGGGPESTAVWTCVSALSIETFHHFVRVKQTIGQESYTTKGKV